MFYVMDMVEGRVLWDGSLQELPKPERRAVYENKIATLAKLHNTDHEKIGLADFGKPGNYFARQIDRWSKQYKLSETENIDEMNRLIEWLPATIPPGERTGIVHGDYRLDNLILHASEPRVIAVLGLGTVDARRSARRFHLLSHELGDAARRPRRPRRARS